MADSCFAEVNQTITEELKENAKSQTPNEQHQLV